MKSIYKKLILASTLFSLVVMPTSRVKASPEETVKAFALMTGFIVFQVYMTTEAPKIIDTCKNVLGIFN